MLKVKTSIRLSPIHGLGLFAAEPIRQGQLIWIYDPKFDSKVSSQEADQFTESRKATLHHFAYRNDQGQWILCGDGALFMNHSDDPNCERIFHDSEFPQSKEPITRAIRDIETGEELAARYL